VGAIVIIALLSAFVIWKYLFQGIEDKIKNDIASKNNVVILFSAKWCGSCVKQKPIVNEIKSDYPNVNFYVVGSNLNKLEQKLLFNLHNVQGLPTFVLFKDGQEQKRLVGLQTQEELREDFSIFK